MRFELLCLDTQLRHIKIKMSQDLQTFIDKFQPSKYKLMAKGIEIRGIYDMHRNLVQAKDIIERLELSLIVSHNAEMLTYGGFEVNIVS